MRTLCVGLLLLSTAAAAQEEYEERPPSHLQAGIMLGVGIPMGEFGENVDNVGFGVTGNFGYAPADFPLAIGVDLGYVLYGSTTRDIPIPGVFPPLTARVTNTNNLFTLEAFLRLQPLKGSIRPYLQGQLGGTWFFTTASAENAAFEDGSSTSTSFTSGVFHFGGGGGVLIHLTDLDTGELFLDLAGRYIIGGEAEYFTENEVVGPPGSTTYRKVRSRTDLMFVTAGVTFRF